MVGLVGADVAVLWNIEGTLGGSPVPARPLLVRQPDDVVVDAERPAALHCQPPEGASVAWRHGGLLLSPSPDRTQSVNGSLHFVSVQPADEGDYQCQVTLQGGGILLSRRASLQLAELESAGGRAAQQTVFLGQTARLECGVRGRPAPSISWLKDDQPLQLDTSRMTVLPSGALELDHAQMFDQADYVCRAENERGFVLGPRVRLGINTNYDEASEQAAPTFVARPADTEALRGDNVTLECAANGNPRPQVTWLKDGNTINMSYLDRRFFRVGVSSLQIVDVREEDSGSYQCRIYNSADSDDASARLIVKAPPEFVLRPSPTSAAEKEDVELTCEARGSPTPTITWTKDGERLHNSNYFQLADGGRRLRILGLVPRDAGIYQCFASNDAGNIQTAARLSVRDLDSDGRTLNGGGAGAAAPGDDSDGTAASAPRGFNASSVGSREVTLVWREPLSSSGAVTGYSVVYREQGSDRERVQNTSAGSSALSVQLHGLQPDTEYELSVRALLGAAGGRPSPPLLLRTRPERTVPAAPGRLRLTAVGATRLLARWEPVEPPPNGYTLYLTQSEGGSGTRTFNTTATELLVGELRKFTVYRARVAALGPAGVGPSSAEQSATTWSDVPSETPQNVTVQTDSDTSVVLHWQPPPPEQRNGHITGYKIRYKLQSGGGGQRAQTVVTDASRRTHTLTGLKKDAEYLVKMAALTVNGTGPYTRWHAAQTFHRLQVETTVPDQPASLRARPTETTITVLWSPPLNDNIRVRGYKIGWGRGVPDTYTELIDAERQRFYVIDGLEPHNEYVVSLRAVNAAGPGLPIYETLWTRDRPADARPLVIPTGLKVTEVTDSTASLEFTDRSLPSQDEPADGRQYRVRYSTQANPDRYRYQNATGLSCRVEGLRPATTYEFSVQTVKGHRESDWSLVVENRTREAPPSSPPRDLTIVQSEENPAIINLSWQPPRAPNGPIDGYVILYTTDRSLPDREWRVHPVVGDRMTTTITGLTPSTHYWFRIQARNGAGTGPISRAEKLVTSSGGGLGDNLLYVIIACAVTLLLVVTIVAVVCLCKRQPAGRLANDRRGHKSNSYVKSQTEIGTPDLKPPDLWIHHDQMELRPLGKHRSDSCGSLRRPSPDYEPDGRAYSSTLDRKERLLRAQSPGAGKGYAYRARSEDRLNAQLQRRSFKPKPIVVPIDVAQNADPGSSATALANGTVETRPVYPRTQFSISRAGVEPPPPPAPSAPESHYGAGLGLTSASSSEAAGPAGLPPGYSASSASSIDSGSLGKRVPPPTHPLKSFGVPAPPPPLPAGPRALGSPLKRPSFASSPRASDGPCSREEMLPLQPSYSTEELTQEMANLEGLMKDLNAITASEFQC
ncbi:Neogenin [Amphibalanus amphitrite]|uniref:Neogenin n=1 Tax=Amphibalanus amphitrite TaxID=1232801 RepID=A0A6A4XDM0_AMPAM|nr:Neogenin [Amphibalanus amphitrite]